MENNFCGCSWSGGKDSCFALMLARESGMQPAVLLSVLNEEGKITRSHGIPAGIIEAQAGAMGLPFILFPSSWNDYEAKFTKALNDLKEQYSIETMVFGDIDLDEHRAWEEKVCEAAGLQAVLPLWKQDRKKLVLEMMDKGIVTMIVSCNETMGPSFIGKFINAETIVELETAGVDVCGENGEFHTLVLDCPLFSKAIEVEIRGKINHDKYWFAELSLGQTLPIIGLEP